MINTNMTIDRIGLEERAGDESGWENKRNILLGKIQMTESKMREPMIYNCSFFSITLKKIVQIEGNEYTWKGLNYA